MKHVVHKVYADYEREEKWLNEMSARGLMLTDYSWCRYVFEEAPKGEYIYRIELLENWPTHPESVAYIRFLEENGIECAGVYMRWVYLRKKASEGPFDIYSDIDSKIRHYRRVNALWSTLMALELSAGVMNVGVGIADVTMGKGIGSDNILLGGLLILLGIIFFWLGGQGRRKIRLLKRERAVRE